jgi:hypothetical protein
LAASGGCEAIHIAPFSSAELFRLLSREQLTPAAPEIEEFQVEDEPRIANNRGPPGKNAPAIRALGFSCFHKFVLPPKLRAAGSGGDEAVDRFAHRPGEGDRGASFEGCKRN